MFPKDMLKDVGLSPVFFSGITAISGNIIFDRNIVILLEEVKTNFVKLHISQNIHGFTVNMNRNEFMVDRKFIPAFFIVKLSF